MDPAAINSAPRIFSDFFPESSPIGSPSFLYCDTEDVHSAVLTKLSRNYIFRREIYSLR